MDGIKVGGGGNEEARIQPHITMEATFRSSSLRSIMLDGKPWFLAQDICEALELSDPTTMLRKLHPSEKRKASVVTVKGPRSMAIVNESGVYLLAFNSTKPEAVAFRMWVTDELLPALRRGAEVQSPQTRPPVEHLSLQDLEDGTYVRHFYSPEVDALAIATALLGPLWRRYRLLDGMDSLSEHSNVSFQLGEAIQLAEHIAVSAMRTKRELIDGKDDPVP